MDETKFWNLLARSLQHGPSAQYETLVGLLEELPSIELVRFEQIYDCFVAAAERGGIYGASALLTGSTLSDDSFLYFRNWLVAQGREVYEQALIEPDSLSALPEVDPQSGAWDQDIVYAAWDVLGGRADKDVSDDADDDPCEAEGEEFDWMEYTPAVLQQKFPRLWARYGERYQTD